MVFISDQQGEGAGAGREKSKCIADSTKSRPTLGVLENIWPTRRSRVGKISVPLFLHPQDRAYLWMRGLHAGTNLEKADSWVIRPSSSKCSFLTTCSAQQEQQGKRTSISPNFWTFQHSHSSSIPLTQQRPLATLGPRVHDTVA